MRVKRRLSMRAPREVSSCMTNSQNWGKRASLRNIEMLSNSFLENWRKQMRLVLILAKCLRTIMQLSSRHWPSFSRCWSSTISLCTSGQSSLVYHSSPNMSILRSYGTWSVWCASTSKSSSMKATHLRRPLIRFRTSLQVYSAHSRLLKWVLARLSMSMRKTLCRLCTPCSSASSKSP